VILVLAALTGPATAGARRGFLLQLHDPGGYLSGSPVVELKGSEGSTREVRPLDDGNPPDVKPDDDVWTVAVPSFLDPRVDIEIKASGRSWTGSAKLDPDDVKALVRLRLEPDGQALAEAQQVPAAPAKGSSGSDQAAATSTGTGPGALLWALAFAAVGLGTGLGFALVGRRPRGRARVEEPAVVPVPPRRLEAGDVTRALAGPLAGHRVLVLGEAPDGPLVHRCTEPAPLPRELVAAVEHLAVVAGPPVALLVTEPARLDRSGPWEPVPELARRVAGRFPLFVVGGPPEWPA
jgi:hypothetical protein